MSLTPDFRELESHTLTAGESDAGTRLDVFLTSHWPDYSRTLMARLIKDGHVEIDGLAPKKVKPALKLEGGEVIHVERPPMREPKLEPEDIPLDILYQDEAIIVVNKQPGLACHPPTAGRGGTLANALLFHFQQLSRPDPIRPGIVHRLDADTSGVMVCAKDESAHFKLARQFEQRTVSKTYLAIARGRMKDAEGLIDKPIARHPDRYEMQRVHADGKPAQTRFAVKESFRRFCYLELFPKTGRTHQIRVHLAAINHPVVSDRLYSRMPPLTQSEVDTGEPSKIDAPLIGRHALHAHRIEFDHPRTNERVTFTSEPPDDFTRTLTALRESKFQNRD